MKEELPVPARPRGDGLTAQFCMGPGYQEQLWIKLSSGTVQATNTKTAWDLAFESTSDGWRVELNGSRLMTAWDLGAVEITAGHDTAGMSAGRRIDAPSGHPDSTAIGDWRGTAHVFLIDQGYNALGQQLGYRKLRMDGVSPNAYNFTHAALDGSDVQAIMLPKDPSRTRTSFSFATGAVTIAPPAADWDIVLTQYTHQFYEPFLPYIVTGVLSNTRNVRVARIAPAQLEEVTLADTLDHPFSTRRDAIGYDWKRYSFETSSYTVDATVVYIVQDAQGFFHKLRFLEFYDGQGQVGCPSFEVVPL
jgi:hypothetical protein